MCIRNRLSKKKGNWKDNLSSTRMVFLVWFDRFCSEWNEFSHWWNPRTHWYACIQSRHFYFDDKWNGSWVCEWKSNWHTNSHSDRSRNDFKVKMGFFSRIIRFDIYDWKIRLKTLSVSLSTEQMFPIFGEKNYPCESISMLSIHYRSEHLNVNSCVFECVFCCCRCIHSLLKFIFQIKCLTLSKNRVFLKLKIVRKSPIRLRLLRFCFLFVTFGLTGIVTKDD